MGERLPCKQEARGSIPLISTTSFFENHIGEAKASKVPNRGSDLDTKTPRRRSGSCGKVKIVRAYGGCLGAKSRRRTWLAAKSFGEP